MSETSDHSTSVVDDEFLQELHALDQKLTGVIDQLTEPLHQLVHVQHERSVPYVRGAIVLATAIPVQDSETMKRRRIHFAAALEMLFIAHNIHKLLLAPQSQMIDKSMMGSTILAGDFCFSHSALLAAGSESPEVVSIFAQALKTVSESNLRSLFGEDDYRGENSALFSAAVDASAIMASLSVSDKERITEFVSAYSSTLSAPSRLPTNLLARTETLPMPQQARWRALLRQMAKTV